MSAGWNTIESDAGVFTSLIETLGVKNVQFEELLSLDAEYLHSLGQPLYGVIFLFKYPSARASTSTTTATSTSAPVDGEFDYAAGERLFFAQQVITNACATQALLALLLNQSTTNADADADAGSGAVTLGAELSGFRDFTLGFPPALRGEALSNSEPIRSAHNSFARASPFISDATAPSPDDNDADDDLYHYIAYTRVDGTLWELDGLQPAPISHGACAAGADDAAFAERLVDVLRRRIQRHGDAEIRFSLLAAVPDPRPAARARADWPTLERELAKRRAWAAENALRRHNFLAFTTEMLRSVVARKLAAGEYNAWLADAVAATQRRIDSHRTRKEDQASSHT